MSSINRAELEQLDHLDPLAALRDEFVLPADLIYLDGNSLGAMPKAAAARVSKALHEEWSQGLVGSWNTAGWYNFPVQLGDKIATLIGADAGEVVVTDSTSVDVYKVLVAALRLRPQRRVIVMEGSNFPSDNYVAQGLVQQLGGSYSIRFVEADELESALTDDVAALCLTQVHYKTGRVLDMSAWTARAHAQGALAVWDLCHSAGAIPVELNVCDADFAVGCTYKYLNGGPGSPAFLFAARRHQGQGLAPLTGWWGHAKPFAFEPDYRPATDIRQMLSGTPPILSMLAAEAGIDLMIRADIKQLRNKSLRMTEVFIELIEQRCAGFGLELASPRAAEQRGSQVSFWHAQGYAIMQALIDRGVIGDYREPGNMRFGFAPAYVRYLDLWDAVEILRDVLAAESWRDPQYEQRQEVT